MKLSRRNIWLLAIALGAIILLTLFAAPQNNNLSSGSTYSRAPDGYAGWYAFMQKQGTPLQRWQKPFESLAKDKSKGESTPEQSCFSPQVMLRVYSWLGYDGLYSGEREWVEKGNTLVILGVRQPVTEANFTTMQESPDGSVKIETTRRRKKLKEGEKQRLGDRFGAIVWEKQIGKGRAIFSTTPYLAANAYQDEPGNFKFLAKLVTESITGEKICTKSVLPSALVADSPSRPQAEKQSCPITQSSGNSAAEKQNCPVAQETRSTKAEESKNQSPIYVDEHIHGHKDQEVIAEEGTEDWLSYLAKTPLLAAFVQVGVILVILILANIRRFGQPITLSAATVNNSEAYIQALAGVLRKAESSEFVLETIGKEEKMQLQTALGLGQSPIDTQTLVNVWAEETGRKPAEILEVLQQQSQKHRISEQDLLNWLEKWQNLRELRGTGD